MQWSLILWTAGWESYAKVHAILELVPVIFYNNLSILLFCLAKLSVIIKINYIHFIELIN